jgi:glycosyltransferase involved in cell wall biosynthesis
MKIGINTSPLATGHNARGIGVYTKELIRSLSETTTSHTFVQFTGHVPQDIDIVHYPFFDPFFATLPVHKTAPTVVTVHDLIPLRFPDKFPPGIRGSLTWRLQRWSLSGAKRIITDSETSRKDISAIVGYPAERIDVIPLAARPVFVPEKDPTVLSHAIETYHLPDAFVLYVGDVNWNKNIAGLLLAWQQLTMEKHVPRGMKLLLVGTAFTKEDLSEAKEIRQQVDSLSIADSVMMTGYVPDDALRAIYTLCRASIMPSWYEGFGFPLLEAMACGAVTVASDVASLSEIAGPSIRVHPKSSHSIAQGIAQAVSLRTGQREAFADAGMKWASAFTWKKVASDTIRSYEKMVE